MLLDTHALLWFSMDDAQLSRNAKDLLEDPANTGVVSAATFWEVAIKARLGKLKLGKPYAQFLETWSEVFEWLPIEPAHLLELNNLPPPGKHRDPFDRLLVARAIAEKMPIVSCDEALAEYPVTLLW